jgi:hypothetical protein
MVTIREDDTDDTRMRDQAEATEGRNLPGASEV